MKMKIALLGPEGTFSDMAYMEYAKDKSLQPVYCATIDEVFEQVCEKEECDYGIVPIENTLDGYVMRTLDLILEEDVVILDENKVKVQFSLVGNVSGEEEIKQLFVQFKANGQCRKYINSLHGVKLVTTESNMESYYKIGDEPGNAAVVPMHVAADTEKKYIIDNITDADNNYTRFVIFKKGRVDLKNVKKDENTRTFLEKQKIRIPVYIMPAVDKPGVLFEILREFYDKRINLLSIMSRPTKHEMGTYNFYIEIDGLYEALDEIAITLNNIKKENDIKILGIYSE